MHDSLHPYCTYYGCQSHVKSWQIMIYSNIKKYTILWILKNISSIIEIFKSIYKDFFFIFGVYTPIKTLSFISQNLEKVSIPVNWYFEKYRLLDKSSNNSNLLDKKSLEVWFSMECF